MAFFVVMTLLILVAVLAPIFGVDSRGLVDRLPDPPEPPGGSDAPHPAVRPRPAVTRTRLAR